MARHGLRQGDVGKALDLSQAAIGARLTGATEWRMVELLVVSRLIGVPFVDLCAAWESEQTPPATEGDVDPASPVAVSA